MSDILSCAGGSVLALLLSAIPSVALAQQTALTRDIVVTATASPQKAEESGRAITVIDRAIIETRQTVVVSDMLATTPGITVSRNGGPGQPTAVRIRGAEDSQTLVLIDGVRVNDPSSPTGAYDFGNLLANNIERIEVLRGPNSVPWGSQALGGVVNIVTALPTTPFAVRASGEYGDRDAVRLAAEISTRRGPVAATIGGAYLHDDGVSAYRFGSERDGFRQYAANGRVEVELAPDVSIDLRGNYANSRVSFDGFPPPTFSFADTSGFAATRQAFGYAGLNARLGGVGNRLAFTIADTRRRNFTTATAAPSIFNGRVERYEYQGDAVVSDVLRTVFGIEHENSRFADGRTTTVTGLTSGYAQLIAKPVAALTLTGGARVDRHRTYGTEATFSANGAWVIGATTLRASYGEGFKAPTLFQLFGSFGNRALQPETAQSYEIGIEQSLLDTRLTFGVTYFHRDTTNQIDFFSCPNGKVCIAAFFYDNIARTRARGFEASVEVRPSPTLVVTANYTQINARNRLTGLVLLRRPRHSVNANIDWQPLNGVSLGAGVRTVSDSRDSDFRTFTPTTLDGHVLGTVRASVAIGSNLELYGRVENLFDARYETVSGYGTDRRNAHIGVRVKL